ncbi:MAG: type II toxin-antitoxin system VapC family toxin [Gemmataceae bacterium]|nr:type II toxin-antitoxin system VapC family toxin [Gemmataceae bacterium]
MNVLLDTHALLWFYLDSPQLSPLAKATIEAGENEVWVSPASYWEIAIKMGLGKLNLAVAFDEFVKEAIADYDFEILHIIPEHASEVLRLPMAHKDPFDRMLAAQARIEKMPLVSADAVKDQYGIARIW